jgi:Tol biopolymer transport system component
MNRLVPIAVAALLADPAGAQNAIESAGFRQISGLENTYPAWSQDGKRIVFESTRDGPDADIFVMNADGTGVVQLTRNGYSESTPVFTPDGASIVFASEQDGNLDVFIMRADGSGLRNLTRHPGADGHPRVSPDGKRIYFNSNRTSDPATFARGTMDREHNHEIFSMSPDGGDVRQVTNLPDWDTYPAVSPDGRELLWRRIAPTGGKSESGRNSEVFWMDLATGEMRNVTAHQAYDGWPAWSPDGRRIAFASNRANAEFEAFDIYVAERDGSNAARVTFGDGVDGRGSWTKPQFSADGKRILCTRTVGASVDIFVIDLK